MRRASLIQASVLKGSTPCCAMSSTAAKRDMHFLVKSNQHL
jgi:hypothetical protein